jgi:DNA repair protein RadC
MRIFEASVTYKLVKFGEAKPLSTADVVAAYMADAFDDFPTQEGFFVICLDRKNRPIGRTRITLGTLTSTLVHPREIFRIAILASAASIIVVHNHPSGDPAPSSADIQITRQLREASKIIDIELLDHVILGTKEDDPARLGFYSFRSAGIL